MNLSFVEYRTCVLPHDDQCFPISKLEDVWTWSDENACKWDTKPLQPSTNYCYKGSGSSCHLDWKDWKLSPRIGRETVPKTLVCHDMKGGYLGDRFINGTQVYDEYRFFHWAGIDIFVYFSHHLVTIPPPMWINAAHLHGVKILGTFITEWKSGEKICQEILKNPESIKKFIMKLVGIADHYGFDGWLVNIENKVCDEVGQVKDLVSLVDQLRNEMHNSNPDSLVIWYDSVTGIDGKLDWQNELNSCNRIFFDHCDGIFLNYAWEEKNIEKSKTNALDRLHDVYVGIDVFGRKFYEGGGFNTYKALEVARKYNLSVAIFAPGWVHEIHGPENFSNLEYFFWKTLQPYLYLHGPTKLPFQTSFCHGAGLMKYHLGQVVSNSPWFNLSLQQYQPSTGSCRYISFEDNKIKTGQEVPGCIENYVDDAFNGGGSLILQMPRSGSNIPPGSDISSPQRILLCSLFCSEQFILSIATKKLDEDAELGILVKVKTVKGKHHSFLLQEKNETVLKFPEDLQVILPVDDTQEKRLKEQFDMLGAIPSGLSIDRSGNWEMRYYLIPQHQVTILEIGALIHVGSVLLGFLDIRELKPRE
ncbi:cytosolic endo-beta-N-acetylglucosaminidase isoform X2 [Ischnura elegans]|uniref:cytosolic endo-beta-N-acetylglucosaminidase isoform X2 n=1 Tax=Ischnura elegans TaxID=197161 RepID=UPI001ED889F2|nr:cytosolic endo-beta-N-acetylglucosaminidase isoform X2 [Ischnura elegans]